MSTATFWPEPLKLLIPGWRAKVAEDADDVRESVSRRRPLPDPTEMGVTTSDDQGVW